MDCSSPEAQATAIGAGETTEEEFTVADPTMSDACNTAVVRLLNSGDLGRTEIYLMGLVELTIGLLVVAK